MESRIRIQSMDEAVCVSLHCKCSWERTNLFLSNFGQIVGQTGMGTGLKGKLCIPTSRTPLKIQTTRTPLKIDRG